MWSDISLWFWFAFLWWLVMLSIFSCDCWPSVCLFWKNICSSLLPTFLVGLFGFLVLRCVSYQELSCANIYSHSVGCLFVLLMVSFAVQKLLCLIRFCCLCLLYFYCLKRQIRKKWSLSRRFQGVLRFQVLHLGLYTILSLYLYMVWGNVLIPFFKM